MIENSKLKNFKINLMSIDIENYEFEALKYFDFKKYNIDVIVTEITDSSIKDLETYNLSLDRVINTDVYKLLIKNNYRLINWINSDLIFIQNNRSLR